MKNNRKSEYLPLKLIDGLNQDLIEPNGGDYRTKNNFIRCTAIIFSYQLSEAGISNYVPLGAAYWKKTFSSDYYKKVLQPLLELNIIQSQDFGFRNFNVKGCSSKSEVVTRYRINPLLCEGGFGSMHYNCKGKVLSAVETTESIELDPIQISEKNYHVDVLKERASAFIAANAEAICRGYYKPDYINYYPENYKIEYREWVNGTFNKRYLTLGAAKGQAKSQGLELFYFNKGFYMACPNEFLTQRQELLKYNYHREVSKIGSLTLEDKRNPKTLRVYNDLVNFPSKLLSFITINGQSLNQYDLKTSQFLLFANILNVYLYSGGEGLLKLFKHPKNKAYLKKLIGVLDSYKQRLPPTGIDITNPQHRFGNFDVDAFIQDVFYQDFYAVVQKQLNLPERAVAKQTLFKLMFRKGTGSDALIDKLKLRYPTLLAIIDEFKTLTEPQNTKSKGKNSKSSSTKDDQIPINESDNNFSVFLQCIEAEIFIDNILIPLRTAGVPCFTRHDSVCTANACGDIVESKINSVFAGYGFKCNLKCEEKYEEVYSLDELEESGFSDYLANRIDEIDSEVYEDSYVLPEKSKHTYELKVSEGDNSVSTIKSEDQNLSGDDVLDDDDDEVNEWEDVDPDIIEKLIELGIQDDYSDSVDEDLLQDLLQLPLTTDQATALEIELENLKQGMSCFQDETNEVIREVVTVVVRKFIE